MNLGAKQISSIVGAVLSLATVALAGNAAAAELIMFERAGCPWCLRWDREVAPGYSKTAEGRRAPLRRHKIEEGQPKDIQLARPVRYTPTFVLVERGREAGRITGYIDNGMFWGLLTEMIAKLQPEPGETPHAIDAAGRAAPTEKTE